MSPADIASLRERAAWRRYCESQSLEDLTAWRKALQVLNDELEHRTRLLHQQVKVAQLGAAIASKPVAA